MDACAQLDEREVVYSENGAFATNVGKVWVRVPLDIPNAEIPNDVVKGALRRSLAGPWIELKARSESLL
jgi:hypothetical protein